MTLQPTASMECPHDKPKRNLTLIDYLGCKINCVVCSDCETLPAVKELIEKSKENLN